MKKSLTPERLLWLGAVIFALALAFTAPAADDGLVTVDNARDPICGMKISKVPRANTAQYQGQTIGFCSSHCRAAWDKLSAGEKEMKIYPEFPRPGVKSPLDSGHYFIYGFSSPPKLGAAIMKVEIFTLDGKRDTTFRVTGDADMPSMRGAHGSGNRKFSVSAKGFYLLPVQLVMPGDWEIRIVFEKDGRAALRGSYRFDL